MLIPTYRVTVIEFRASVNLLSNKVNSAVECTDADNDPPYTLEFRVSSRLI